MPRKLCSGEKTPLQSGDKNSKISSMAGKLKSLGELYLTFCKIGAMTFGGGLAMMPMMQRELIEKRGWITEEDLIDYYAIGQSTPGIVAVNVSTFVGYRRAGVAGGIAGTAGMVTPSLIIIMILANLISSAADYPWMQNALSGVNVAVAALLTKVVLNFMRTTIKNLFTLAVALVSFVLVYFLDVPSFFIILGAIALGSAVHLMNLYNEKKNGGGGKDA